MGACIFAISGRTEPLWGLVMRMPLDRSPIAFALGLLAWGAGLWLFLTLMKAQRKMLGVALALVWSLIGFTGLLWWYGVSYGARAECGFVAENRFSFLMMNHTLFSPFALAVAWAFFEDDVALLWCNALERLGLVRPQT